MSVQTDVYQVGALLLRLTAGDGVFCQLAQDYPPNSQEEAAALRCGSLLTAGLCQPHVPCGLRRVIAKAIHRRPESRYTDVLAFQNALAPIADLLDWRCSKWDTEGSEFVLDHNGRTESVVLHRRGGVWFTEGYYRDASGKTTNRSHWKSGPHLTRQDAESELTRRFTARTEN